MTYRIVKVDNDGKGYAVVTQDDGSTFGQNFVVTGWGTQAEFLAMLEKELAGHADRLTWQSSRVQRDLSGAIGATRPIQR